jgi:hypothetical protein
MLGMIYSDLRIQIKLRNLDELLYISSINTVNTFPSSVENYRSLIKCKLMGTYVYVGKQERIESSKFKYQTLITKFSSSDDIIKTAKDIRKFNSNESIIQNSLQIKLNSHNPCKYLLWRVDGFLDSNLVHPSDIVYWDIAGIPARNPDKTININIKSTDVISRFMLQYNGRTRENFKNSTHSQLLIPFNKKIGSLDPGEYINPFCLYINDLAQANQTIQSNQYNQPSGTDNLGEIEDPRLIFDLNDSILDKKLCIRIKLWYCSHTVFINLSGFGALLFTT